MLRVLIVMTTKPCDEIRGPYQETADWVLVKPGAIAMAPKVPDAVLVG
jgi:hypothetical protein